MLGERTASARRLALVGLAKNTGKTEALASLLRELESRGRRVGVTSVGRDGEERDVIDSRIEKPRVHLAAHSIVATTDSLLNASGIPHERLVETSVRTPLGRVLVARLRERGTIELAGPSGAEQVRSVSDAMLGYGAEQVLIDGAIDRRAASSPDVADGLLMATGAVLGEDIEEVIAQTRDAVDLVRLPRVVQDGEIGTLARAMAARGGERTGALLQEGSEPLELPPRFALTGEAAQIAKLLDARPAASRLLIGGALPDRFLRELLLACGRRGRELRVVVSDPTRVFLAERGVDWYRRQGLHLEVLSSIELMALTVNPLAPRSHRFDSAQLRGLLAEAIPDVPIFDVLDPGYASSEPRPAA